MGNYCPGLTNEISQFKIWFQNKYPGGLMEEEYAQGTLSHFIQRKRKYTLLDFLNEAGLDNYHRLTRCAQFVASIQPVTSRVESMFSFQRHTEHVNMSPETLEATMMLKMDKCGGVRRIFNN